MTQLGLGVYAAGHYEDALTVQEAELSFERRLGVSKLSILVVQNNLANTYDTLGRHEEAMCLRQDVYSGRLILHGEEDEDTISSAMNYVGSLVHLRRFEEAKSLLRKWVPVARRVLGEGKILTLRIRQNYAIVLCMTASPTLNDLSEAVTTLEDTERIARRVLGGSHPLTVTIERHLREAQRERDAAAALANE